MKNNKKIEDLLDKQHIRGLTSSEKDIVWQRIVSAIEKPVPSPWYLPTNNKFKPMIPLMIAAVMFLGVGGTAVMADNSRPGDVLFGIDRAAEEVRIAFAGKAKAADLKAKFAEERLSEVQALVTDARLKASASTTASTTGTTTATTTTSRKDQQVGVGVNVALSYLSKVSADLEASGNLEAQARIQTVIERLETLVNTDGVKATVKSNEDFKLRLKGEVDGDKIEINTNGNKSRIEVREEGNRIRIELKDNGLINLKGKIELDSDDEESDDKNDEDEEDDDEDDDDKEDDDDEESNRRGRGLEIRANVL